MTNNQLLIDMLMQLSNRTMRSDELGGSRDWLVADSLTRKGFLHYADLRNGASVVRLQKWQIATFWVLAFATLIQAFAALKALDLFPWSTGEEQTESTPNEPAGREADKSTDDDSATTHPTQAGQMLPQGTLVLCGHCDTLGPQTKVPLKHPEE